MGSGHGSDFTHGEWPSGSWDQQSANGRGGSAQSADGSPSASGDWFAHGQPGAPTAGGSYGSGGFTGTSEAGSAAGYGPGQSGPYGSPAGTGEYNTDGYRIAPAGDSGTHGRYESRSGSGSGGSGGFYGGGGGGGGQDAPRPSAARAG
jgi:hypothetical protein